MMSGVTGMKLARFDLYRYGLPFSRPLTLGSITRFQREGLLLKLSGDDGSEGWGETAPLPGFSVEGLVDATAQLRRLAASMIGREVREDWVDPYGEFGGELDRVAPSVRFGLELAVWNLYAASSGKTLPEMVTPFPRVVVPVNGLLAGSPADVLVDAWRMRDTGYRSIKLKIGTRTVAEAGVLSDGPCTDLELDAPVSCVPHAPRIHEYIRGRSCEQPVYWYHDPRKGSHHLR